MNHAHRMHTRRALMALAAALGFAACSGGGSGDAADTARTSAAQDSAAPMSGMDGMPGMQAPAAGGMMEQMQAHLRLMDGAGADSIHALLPTHRQMVANMIAQFNKDMRDMNMMADANWTATVDSLRQDLTRMPEMSASELQRSMPAHEARVVRLMGSHRTMMGSMSGAAGPAAGSAEAPEDPPVRQPRLQ